MGTSHPSSRLTGHKMATEKLDVDLMKIWLALQKEHTRAPLAEAVNQEIGDLGEPIAGSFAHLSLGGSEFHKHDGPGLLVEGLAATTQNDNDKHMPRGSVGNTRDVNEAYNGFNQDGRPRTTDDKNVDTVSSNSNIREADEFDVAQTDKDTWNDMTRQLHRLVSDVLISGY